MLKLNFKTNNNSICCDKNKLYSKTLKFMGSAVLQREP
jgi:hypothetical protein